ncbi:hypothetical protein ACERZ8_09585 [Tateyamaria armeniaca]|uniref:Uncharacterized protein n=1 Tax=Tateyamaria armeniaca TaxID=2518930 RepID=A0ABW8USL3_9RHOB
MREGLVALNLLNADLGGAPEFWRNVDWLPDPNREIEPSAPTRPGIPFDKVDYLLEYDARQSSRPEAQGWTATGPATARFRLENGLLAMSAPPAGNPVFFSASAPLDRGVPEQIHCYAVVAPGAAGRVVDGAPGFFEVRHGVQTDTSITGTRGGWHDTSGGLQFQYVRMDGSGAIRPVTEEARGDLRSVWQRLSMQADLRAEETLLSVGDAIDQLPLGAFGFVPDAEGEPGFVAQFGLFNRRLGGQAWLRNAVFSAPGRFMRVRLRAVVPGDDPTLRLVFVADQTARGDAVFAVRYTDDPQQTRTGLAGTQVTGAVAAPSGNDVAILDLRLTGLRDGSAATLLIERSSLAEADTLRGSLRLMSASLLPSQGGDR